MIIEKYDRRKHREDALYIAANLKEQEQEELRDIGCADIAAALLRHFEISDSYIVKVGAVPIWGFGVLANEAWLLGSKDALKHKKKFLKASKAILEELLRQYEFLYNYAPVDYLATIRWLKSLGAGFYETQEKNGRLYVKFILRRSGDGCNSSGRHGRRIKPCAIPAGQGAGKGL